MLFSSMIFLWGFLPLVILLYFLCGRKLRNTVLLLASLVFYAWGERAGVLLMLASIGINYAAGLGVHLATTRARRLTALWLGILLNLLLLGYFKYFNFLIDCVNSVRPHTLTGFARVALPIGISFYTFQGLSYVVDVFRGDCAVQRNPLKLGLYISFFPQLIAGPIVRYHDIQLQLESRDESWQEAAYGVRRFVFGLAKKVLIANPLAMVADNIFEVPAEYLNTPMAWTGALCYMFQIYYDFSGYSDMAIGLGHLFGFRFQENFNYPYLSASITEFWRRWHISLSTWFKEYLYIPLGGNRRGMPRTYLNLFLVFLATGIWHGAAWTFIVWGLYHGLFLLLERAFLKARVLDRLPRWCAAAYCWAVVLGGWVLFRCETLSAAWRHVRAMAGCHGLSPYRPDAFITPAHAVLLVVAFLCCGPLQTLSKRLATALFDETRTAAWELPLHAVLMALAIVCLVSNSYNPFIYFRF